MLPDEASAALRRPNTAAAERRAAKRAANTLFERHTLSVPDGDADGAGSATIEVSAHRIARQITTFLPHVFPDCPAVGTLSVVCTFQKSKFDIMEINDQTEGERLRMFGGFSRFADRVLTDLEAAVSSGANCPPPFADYADLDGTPCRTSLGGSAFNEVEVARSALGYRLTNVGGVSIIIHPTWGRNIYVGSIVTSHDEKDIATVLKALLM
mmetsp:Transcript_20198/g.31161  ORF Transcript_20198/g.31161 Transcript_20198/m.31161 type:complete len:211 (-) Transcript_20198:488-1120(-)